MGQDIEIVRPVVTLKIGTTKVEMSHEDLQKLFESLRVHLQMGQYWPGYYNNGYPWRSGDITYGAINATSGVATTAFGSTLEGTNTTSTTDINIS